MKVSARPRRSTTVVAVALAVAVVAASPAWADHSGDTSPELTAVGQLGADEIGTFGENITDVWAAQGADGRDYAYLGSFSDIACTLDTTGTHIVDITDPTNPAKVGFIADKPGTRTNDVKVEHLETPHFSGDVLVATNEPCGSSLFVPRLNANGGGFIPGQGGISIWDVTDPTNPKPLKQNFMRNGIHNTFVWQDGDNAYLIAVDDVATQDTIIVDITKPQSPKVIATTGQEDWPSDIDNIGADEVFLHDVWVQDGIAYLSYWDAGLVLVDVSDPTNPEFLGDSDYAEPDPLSGQAPEGNSHVAVPNADGSRVLMGDEDFAAGSVTSFEFDGTAYDAGVALFAAFVDGSFSGPVHWTGGEGCSTGEFDRPANPGEIALIQRGSCFFSEKAAAAEALGYAGFVVANHAEGGEAIINMSAGTDDIVSIPGYFVAHSTGETMKANEGATLEVEGVFDGYGYLHLLDVTDPENIVELDQFATENVFANPPLPGDRTMHNVVVDGGTTAYISWYAEGMRVVDFSGDVLTETAHFVDTEQGSNFWGVYLYEHSDGNTYILGSDRNTGLWIFDTP